MPDPRLAAVSDSSGAIDRAKVEALLSREPGTLTLPEIDAMYVIFFETETLQDHAPWLAEVAYEPTWPDAFVKVLGGTTTRETVRHGEVVERSVEHHRGRADVRRYRAEQNKPIVLDVGPIRANARPRGAGRPRAAATRSSARSGDSGDDPPAGESDPPGACWRLREVLAAEVRWRLSHGRGACS